MMKFVHIPKTAGSSILRATPIRSEGHKKLCKIEGDDFFSCTRNPYDRACSLYWFILGRQKLMPYNITARYKTLLEFWQTIEEHKALPRKHIFASQMDFLRDVEGKGGISPRIKHLLRFETLAEDWPAFAAEHGFVDLPHVNKSERPTDTWQDEMTPELIDIINERFADDFEQLGYERLG